MLFSSGFEMRLVLAYRIPVDSPMEKPEIGVRIEYRSKAFNSLSRSVAFTVKISISVLLILSVKQT